jgi:hypothetical protein
MIHTCIYGIRMNIHTEIMRIIYPEIKNYII